MADGLTDAKADFEKKDRELNQIYTGLKKDLPAHLFTVLQEDQRDWLVYRDGISKWQAGQAGQDDPDSSVERWETAAGITESRLGWLKVWRQIPDRIDTWEGRYSDSRGGELEIVAQDGKFYFMLNVVRGPTYHSGSINGVMRVNGDMAWFEIKAEEAEQPTWLTFVREQDGTGRVRIIGENTSYYHGMRAYFEGQYLLMSALQPKDRERVIKGETE